MGFRDSLSGLKKKVKRRLTEGKPNLDGTEADHDGGQVLTAAQLALQDEPESAPVRGSENDRDRREADVDGKGVRQTHSLLHPDMEVVVGSEPNSEGNDIGGEKVERVYPSPSATSIPHGT